MARRLAPYASDCVPGTGSPRCPRCRLPERWCICPGLQTAQTPLQIDVLMHPREHYRPSSTGHLIQRVLPTTRSHVWHHDRKIAAEAVRVPGRELWILHPHGDTEPAVGAPESVQILLLDGSWNETATLARETAGWGRRVCLPMSGVSRYWLRDQQEGARFSTAEALVFLLRAFGLRAAGDLLALQLELHVYAHLRARGLKMEAEQFLVRSPLREAMPELLAQMNTPRPR